jgi:hypothetical protein
MPRKTQLTPKDRAQKSAAGFKHGMYVLRDRGELALAPDGKSRLIELKEQFMSEPGRIEYRQELAAHIALMLEIGFSNVREVAEAGESIWTSSPIKSMGCYLNTLVRLLDGWPKDRAIMDITTILRGDTDDTEDTED